MYKLNLNTSFSHYTIFTFFLFLFSGCSTALHKGIPKGERHKRVETVGKLEQPIIVPSEQTLAQEPPVRTTAEPETPTSLLQWGEVQEMDHSVPSASPENNTSRIPPVFDDTVKVEDTDAALEGALKSEKIARTALIFSYLNIAGMLFGLLLLAALIGFLILNFKYKRQEFVSERSEEDMHKARKIVKIVWIVYLALTLLIIALFFLFLLFFF